MAVEAEFDIHIDIKQVTMSRPKNKLRKMNKYAVRYGMITSLIRGIARSEAIATVTVEGRNPLRE